MSAKGQDVESDVDWRFLPKEILGYIFRYLPRKDQLSFTLVCPQWMDAIDTSAFWRRIVILIDKDFLEPSLIYLVQKYLKYLKVLEVGWSSTASHSSRFPCMRFKDIVKRAGRFFVLLYERFVQIEHLTIFDWYDIYHLKKLTFLVMRFVKRQTQLETITLNNANLYDMNFVHILVNLRRSKMTIKKVTLHYTTCYARKRFDTWIFFKALEMLTNIEVLTIDCWIFWHFFNKLQIRISKLKVINLYLDDSLKKINTIPVIRDKQWEMFFACLPRAIVNMYIEKSLSFEQFKDILQQHYPLVSFTWDYSFYRESCYMDCSQCLDRLANLQGKNLEHICVNFPLQQYHLTDKINYILRKCRKLKSFVFNGVELIKPKNYFQSPASLGLILD